MKIVFVGAGGVGGYFGARLAAAGADVALIARGAHLASIRANGLVVESQLGNLRQKIRAEADPAAIGPADIVLLAVKMWDVESTVAQIKPLVGPETHIVTLQNGIDSPRMLAAAFGAARVLGGVAHIATTIAAPGTIRHTGALARISLGAFGDRENKTAAAFVEQAKAAGIDAVHSLDIAQTIWLKFVFLSAFSAVTAATRLSKGALWPIDETRELVATLVAEAIAVARAEKIDLPADALDKTLAQIGALPDGMKASMLHDLERGAKLELPWLSGTVVRLARGHGLAAPAHAALLAVLAPYAQGRNHVHP